MKLVIGIVFRILGYSLGVGLKPYLGSTSTLVNIALSMIGGSFVAQSIMETRR